MELYYFWNLQSMRLTQGFKMCSAPTEHSNEGVMRVELKAINGNLESTIL